MNKAIVFGATGVIGSALINNLIEHNVEVLVLCRKQSKRSDLIPNHRLIKKLYCSLDTLSEVQNESNAAYDVFYHFAWDKTFGNGRNDYYSQEKNIKYTLDAVALAKKFGCHTFIGAGSQAEYGRFEGKLTPHTPTFPENGYGIAKLCAGQMSREYAHQLGLSHIWVRVLSIYGPNDGAQTMVASTINKLKNGQVAEFTKGEQLWDYLNSTDAAEAFRLLGEKGKDGKIYVLGSGQAKPLKEYINTIADCLNARDLVSLGAIPYSDKQVMHLCADISELSADTGWSPKVDFKKGIENILNIKN